MFSAKHLQIGVIGEQLATEFLKKKGFRIITRNYRSKWSEIDIIAVKKDKTLVFVEVKTLASYNKEIRQVEPEEKSLKPEDNLTFSKLKKLQKTCVYFANRNPNLVDDEKGWQIDLIAVTISKEMESSSLLIPLEVATCPTCFATRSGRGARSVPLPPTGLTNNEKDFVIMHYENIAL